ncbi:putative glutaredoxin [Serratia phage vB_SmaA_3M]|uniref:Glutaredoxin n=3 Tax=Miltonvirus TaxID=2841278 RepID=A0A249Y2L0_9CAUD|nr:putative glutaredoxin [Serratia phage phiMAM1]YP_009842002.1 putative glutaredoxin [Serratia phage vB_SmaA_3M]AFX93598.1 putative glutaredoxin [Serratia phage phiMAM1]ASZ78907.1 glutaredoxin [Serratia phage 2050H1]AYP28392.1 putative glutaredoxin [Serratia phage vB_SmaA_3M]
MTGVVQIYSKKGCQQCIAAENMCKIRHLDFEVLKLDKDYTLEDLQALTGKRSMSMPVIKMPDGSTLDYQGFVQSLKR